MISASIVAMFGPIMAAPLAMPVIWMSRPAMVTVRPASLWIVSVVNMPRAAAISDDSLRPSLTAAAAMPCATSIHGQERADHARGKDQRLVGLRRRRRPRPAGPSPRRRAGRARPCRRWPRPSKSPPPESDRSACGCGRAPRGRRRRGSAYKRPPRWPAFPTSPSVRSCLCGSRLIRQ